MLTPSEWISVFSFVDLGTVLGLAVLPLVASVVASTPNQEEAGTEFDENKVRSQIDEWEKVPTRTLEQQEALAQLYVKLAIWLYESDAEGDLQEIFDLFSKAEAVLRQTLAQGEDEEIRRKLGMIDLHRAVVCNDCDGMDEAVHYYTTAIETLMPLDHKGDGEAKYDIAGMKLNRGQIFHELGEIEKANKDYDEAFLAYRAVEKISDLDTRFYMAKVSVAQGSLYRDMDEPLERIIDAYNRAMRLFVELIDAGEKEHEQELANVLMDRCTASYESYMNQGFECEADRKSKFDDVLLNVGRAIEILDRLGDGETVRCDLFNAYTTQGAMLLDLEQFPESLEVFDRLIRDFSDFATETDPTLVNQFAAVRENRGCALIGLGRFDEALGDFNQAIACREHLQSPDFDLDDDERKIFVPSLTTAYANRANAYAALNKLGEARTDCQTGITLLQPLKTADNEDNEEIEEIESMLKALLEKWS